MRAYQRIIVKKAEGTRRLSKRVATEDGHGWRTEPAGAESFTYEVLLDERELELLGERAARNKGGVARDGALEARILDRVRTP